MRFDPSDVLGKLLTTGRYKFKVIKSQEFIAKESKNAYLGLTLKVQNKNTGQTGQLFCNLSTAKFLFNFCKSVSKDMMDKFQTGEIFPQDCMDKAGECEIDIRPDKNGIDRNNVKFFYALDQSQNAATSFYQGAAQHASNTQTTQHSKPSSDLEPPPFDDEIPF